MGFYVSIKGYKIRVSKNNWKHKSRQSKTKSLIRMHIPILFGRIIVKNFERKWWWRWLNRTIVKDYLVKVYLGIGSWMMKSLVGFFRKEGLVHKTTYLNCLNKRTGKLLSYRNGETTFAYVTRSVRTKVRLLTELPIRRKRKTDENFVIETETTNVLVWLWQTFI